MHRTVRCSACGKRIPAIRFFNNERMVDAHAPYYRLVPEEHYCDRAPFLSFPFVFILALFGKGARKR